MSVIFLFPQILVFFLLIFVVSILLTWVVYRYTLSKGFLIYPNERSSHTVPTPKGGGLSIAIVFLCGIAFLGFFKIIPSNFIWAFLGSGLAITAVGWIDDCYDLKARYRIFVHFFAAGWALFFLGGVVSLDLGFTVVIFGRVVGNVLAFFGIVLLSNLYNFMDGIDGLAASEAVMIGILAGALLAISGAWGIALVAWILAVTVAGFLVWNWSPAKIFMGDTGSVLLGLSFCLLAIAGEQVGAVPILIWILLLLVFIVDAGLATLRRMIKGERWFEAHRTFSYQLATQAGLTHSQVSLRIMGINLFLVLLVIIVWREPKILLPVLIFAFFLLSWIWWRIQKTRKVKVI